MKLCAKCKIEKEDCCFTKDKTKVDGLYSSCKECRKLYANSMKKHIKYKNTEYYIKNKASLSKKHKLYYDANKLELSNKYKEYHKVNKEKIRCRDYKRYYEKREYILNQKKLYAEINKNAIAQRKSKAYLKLPQVLKSLIAKRFACVIGYKQQILKRDNYCCTICQCKTKLVLHHIIPAKTNPIFVLEPSNMIILCKSCHLYRAHAGNYKKLDSNTQTYLFSISSILEVLTPTINIPIIFEEV